MRIVTTIVFFTFMHSFLLYSQVEQKEIYYKKALKEFSLTLSAGGAISALCYYCVDQHSKAPLLSSLLDGLITGSIAGFSRLACSNLLEHEHAGSIIWLGATGFVPTFLVFRINLMKRMLL